jgi:hypothetical protein
MANRASKPARESVRKTCYLVMELVVCQSPSRQKRTFTYYSESPHIIEETLRRSKRKKLTVTSYIDTENLWMSSTTTNLFGAVKGLEKMIKLLETQSGVISDGALMTNMAISRICKQQMESLKGLIEYISRCGTEEEKYTKNWKAL